MAEIPPQLRQNNPANSGANSSAPPNMSAQPQSSTKNSINGLMAFLNEYQQKLVKDGTYEKADQYEIEFAPSSLSASSITKGSDNVDKSKTPFQNPGAASAIDPAKQSTNSKIRTYSVAAGMPIVQFIDQVLRNSDYISNQANWAIPDDPPEEDVQGATPVKDVKIATPLKWFKISVVATPLERDEKRNDYAYKIKFIVSEYPVNSCRSEYFPPAKIRGYHKVYDFWFTGQNTEILDYEQQYNYLYTQTITSPAVPQTPVKPDKDNKETRSKSARPTNDQSTQGADRNTNAIGAGFADSMYSIGDLGKVNMRILGDPAWIMQGDISNEITSRTFDFNPFYPDGTINFDSGQVAFKIQYNHPGDYDLTTGLIDPVRAADSEPIIVVKYNAQKCKNIFKEGKFTQELDGVLIAETEGDVPYTASTSLINRPVQQSANPGVRPPSTGPLNLPKSVVFQNPAVSTTPSTGTLGSGTFLILPDNQSQPMAKDE